MHNQAGKLFAVIEMTPGSGSYWLFDQKNSSAEKLDVQRLSLLLKEHPVIFTDAKTQLRKWNIVPLPHARIICLSTIKKLISKSIHETIKIPMFSSTNEAITWVFNATMQAFSYIDKQKLTAVSELESQVISATIAMECRGLPFNKKLWQQFLDEIAKETHDIKIKLHSMLKKRDGFLLFGEEAVDLKSHHDVKIALEEILGQKLTSTSYENLKDIEHDAAQLLIKYRENTRMLSTYGETFLQRVKDNRIYGNFIPIGSASGRLACHEPNLLALPNHALFQQCLKPKSPKRLLYLDYGAFELRILAGLSDDKTLIKIFNDDLDIHSMVARAVFNTDVSKTINAHLRDQAKVLNFGIIYGMGEQALAKQLKTSLHDAKMLLTNYFKRFARVREYLMALEKDAKQKGYAKTALNRRAYFVGEDRDQGYSARVARNVPIQGTGADIAKRALSQVHKTFYECKHDAHVVNLVHDEMVIECHDNNAQEIISVVKKEMTSAFSSVLPNVSCDVSVG